MIVNFIIWHVVCYVLSGLYCVMCLVLYHLEGVDACGTRESVIDMFQDGAIFHHWRRKADEGKDYPFGRFNKVMTKNSLNSQNSHADYMV